jgi:hypothetical protein
MSVFCILWQKPSPWLRLVITIVIYLGAFRFAPGAAAPLALGGRSPASWRLSVPVRGRPGGYRRVTCERRNFTDHHDRLG